MVTPQAQALALEGTWRIEFNDLDATAGVVDIENRGLVGASSSHHIRGDFRINADAITVFLHLRSRAGAAQRAFLIQVIGKFNTAEIDLQGAVVDEPSRTVKARFVRVGVNL